MKRGQFCICSPQCSDGRSDGPLRPPLRPRSPDTENDGVGVKMEASAPRRSTALASSLPAPDPPSPPTRQAPHPGGLHAPFHCRSWSVSPVLLRGSPDVPSPSVARVSPPRCDPSPPAPDAAFTRSPLSQHQHHLAVNSAARRVRQSSQPIRC